VSAGVRRSNVRAVITIVSFRVLGVHVAADGAHGPHLYDAVDLVITSSDGRDLVLGLRTHDYLLAHDRDEVMWPNGYRPLAITFDRHARRFWDFDEILWLGPDLHPCLVWSNAEGLGIDGMASILSLATEDRLLAGPEGRGLPNPEQLGIDGWDELEVHRISDLVTWRP
jgi:hypothetical protein